MIARLERATERELQSKQFVESQLEKVRDALRRSQYREGIASAQTLRLEDLSELQLREVMEAASTAAEGLSSIPAEGLEAYVIAINANEALLRTKSYDSLLVCGSSNY